MRLRINRSDNGVMMAIVLIYSYGWLAEPNFFFG